MPLIKITHTEGLNEAVKQIVAVSATAQLKKNTAQDLVACFARDKDTRKKIVQKLEKETKTVTWTPKTNLENTIADIQTNKDIVNTTWTKIKTKWQKIIAQTYADQITSKITTTTTTAEITAEVATWVLNIFDDKSTKLIVDVATRGTWSDTLEKMINAYQAETNSARKRAIAGKYQQTYKFLEEILKKKGVNTSIWLSGFLPKIISTPTPRWWRPTSTSWRPITISPERRTSAVFTNFGTQILQEEQQKAKETVQQRHQNNLWAPTSRQGKLFNNAIKRVTRWPVWRWQARTELKTQLRSRTSELSLDDQYAHEADALSHFHSAISPEQLAQTKQINATSNTHVNDLIKNYANGTILTDTDFKTQLDTILAWDPRLKSFICNINTTDNQLNECFSPQYSKIWSNILLIAQKQRHYHNLIEAIKSISPSDPNFVADTKNAIKTYTDATNEFPQQLFDDLSVAWTDLDDKISHLKTQLTTHTWALDAIQNQTINVALYWLQNKKLNEVKEEQWVITRLEKMANKVPRYAKVWLYAWAGMLPLGTFVVPPLIVAMAWLKIRAKFANKHRALEELRIKDKNAFTSEIAKAEQIVNDLSVGRWWWMKYARSAYRENRDIVNTYHNVMDISLLSNSFKTTIDTYQNTPNPANKKSLQESLAETTAILDQYNLTGHSTFSNDDSTTFGKNLTALYHQQKLAMSLLWVTDINIVRTNSEYRNHTRDMKDEYTEARQKYTSHKNRAWGAIAIRTAALMFALGWVKNLVWRWYNGAGKLLGDGEWVPVDQTLTSDPNANPGTGWGNPINPDSFNNQSNIGRDPNILDNLDDIFEKNWVTDTQYNLITQKLQDPNHKGTVRDTLMEVIKNQDKVSAIKNDLLDHAHESVDDQWISELRKATLSNDQVKHIDIWDKVFDQIYKQYAQYYQWADPISASELSQTLHTIQNAQWVIPTDLTAGQIRAFNEYCFMKLQWPRRDIFFDKAKAK